MVDLPPPPKKKDINSTNIGDEEAEKPDPNHKNPASDEELVKFANFALLNNRWERLNQLFIKRPTSEAAKAEKVLATDEEVEGALKRLGAASFEINIRGVINSLKATIVPAKPKDEEHLEKRHSGMDGILENEEVLLRKPEEPRIDHNPDEISQQKLKHFRATCMKLEGVIAPELQTVGEEFAIMVRKKFGTCLHGYRFLLDKRQEGRVTYEDFAAFYQKYPSFGGTPKVVWWELRFGNVEGGGGRGGPSLLFEELAPDEANNLEDFVNVMWEKVGLDFVRLWGLLDQGALNYIDLSVFANFAQDLGFIGDSDLIFRGLASGIGKLYLPDLEYIGKISSVYRQKIHSFLPKNIAAMVNWAQSLGGLDSVFESLQLDAQNREIPLFEFALGIEDLGFYGDCMHCARWLARVDGGTFITIDSINVVMAGHHPAIAMQAQSPSPAVAIKSLKADKKHGCYGDHKKNEERKKAKIANLDRPCYGIKHPKLSTLVVALKGKHEAVHSARQKKLVRKPRPETKWDAHIYDTAELNSCRCIPHRICFSETSAKPVKEEIKKFLDLKKKTRVYSPWDHILYGHTHGQLSRGSTDTVSEIWENDGDVPAGKVRGTLRTMWDGVEPTPKGSQEENEDESGGEGEVQGHQQENS